MSEELEVFGATETEFIKAMPKNNKVMLVCADEDGIAALHITKEDAIRLGNFLLKISAE